LSVAWRRRPRVGCVVRAWNDPCLPRRPDLTRRGTLLAEGLKEAIEPALRRNAVGSIGRLLENFATPGRTLAVYDALGNLVAAAPVSTLPPLPEVSETLTRGETTKGLRPLAGATTYLYATPLDGESRIIGVLAVALDAASLDAVDQGLWQYNGVRFLIVGLGISLITVLVVHASIRRGMLGADLVAFHTQYHCNNFRETMEHTLEARIDAEHVAVVRGRQVTHVKPPRAAGRAAGEPLRYRGDGGGHSRRAGDARAERRARMRRMHDWVWEHNVYRWAGRLVDELSRVPEQAMKTAP
jgi:hypothetical protein